MIVIGDISTPENATTCTEPSKRYFPKRLLSGQQLPTVRSDADGRLWLIFGTDSAFEGKTTVYILEGEFVLTQL